MNQPDKRCKNCSQHLLMHQKFCHECGQKTATHRINFHFLVHEIQHGIFHVDGGILYTLKELFTRPGHTLREYIAGKRQQHFKPLMLVLILGSVCALFQYFLKGKKDEADPNYYISTNVSQLDAPKYIDIKGLVDYCRGIYEWLANHFAFTVLLMIPVAAFAFYLGFRKYRYNYAEWLVIMLFLTGQSLAVYVLFIFLNHFAGINNALFYWVSWGLITVSLIQFFNDKRKRNVIFRSMWSVFLSYLFALVYLFIGITVILLIGICRYGYNNIIPELLKG